MSMPPRSRTGSGPLIAGLIIAAVVIVAVIAFAAAGITPQRLWDSFFPVGGTGAATEQGGAVRNLYDIVFYLAVAIFLIVEGLIAWSVFRYRRKPGDDTLPPQIHGNNLVEVIWTAIPTLIVALLFVLSWQTLNTVEATTPTDIHVRAVAQRFQWSFEYLDANGNKLFTQVIPTGDTGGMFVPVGKPVFVSLRAVDVIHAFYVPKFLFKRDAIPGRENSFDFTVDEPGTYRGQCAELCGPNHGDMTFDVHAVSEADFQAWFDKQVAAAKASPSAAPSGPVASGPAPSGPAPSGSAASGPPPSGPAGSAPAGGPTIELSAANIAFSTNALQAPANQPFTIHFANQDDASVMHNVQIMKPDGSTAFQGQIIPGGQEASYAVPALPAGSYTFICSVHPTIMTGTITVQ